MKSISAPMKSPTRKRTGPMSSVYVRQSPEGTTAATIGMMKSLTSAATSLPIAAPSTTAIASASTFSFTRNCLNSRNMEASTELDCAKVA
jgi:hypothetical protein